MDARRGVFVAFLLALLCLLPGTLHSREARFGDDNIAVQLFADGPPVAGQEWMLALRFHPSAPEWHGYWANPGDAGQGMNLQLDLPDGWVMGKPLYPAPKTLEIAGLMNHIYEGDYVVLVPVTVGQGAPPPVLTGYVEYLACTDRICVPQDAVLTARTGGDFAAWRAQIAPLLDSAADFEIKGDLLRLGIPVPADLELGAPHLFLETDDLGGGLRPQYAAVQTFRRDGNLLVAEIPLKRIDGLDGTVPDQIEGILGLDGGQGLRFVAKPDDVPLEGVRPLQAPVDTPPFPLLLLAAFVGGLLLNVMPCVFPILSLKALSLARAGGDERAARRDALAYTAGVVIACAALGGLVILLRAAGEQIGWAFQLQEPLVVVALFLLAVLITVNFLGLYEVPGIAVAGGSGSVGSSFATGLLAAFVATPCTGPFMALALGAALVVSAGEGMAIFVALGLGLALPFLLLAFVPGLRRRLPKPGAWMEKFRHWMALPMGLTALSLGWLIWRMGGVAYILSVAGIAIFVILGAVFAGFLQRNARGGGGTVLLATLAVTGLALALLPRPLAPQEQVESLLKPAEFSQTALANARATGRPVFVWFTADWCVTCKVNEQVAIERETTREAFERAGVVALRADWTQRDEAIASFLAEQGVAGIPLYLWYEPGGDAEQLPQVLTPGLLVERAHQ